MPARAVFDEVSCNGGAQGDADLHLNKLAINLQESMYTGEVAISGISGRMPESLNMEEFEQHLMNKEDMVTTDERRWKTGYHGLPERNGKLKEIQHFDAGFFGVHPKQADSMDPQLRMLLEVCYEAILDAGQSLEAVRGSRTGVYIGGSTNESCEVWGADADDITGYAMLGSCRAMFANRISYFFDFKGPSYTVDTACSSGMTCFDQALLNIRAGLVDQAIVGGANLCLKPNTSVEFNSLGMLAADGACKTFDASGNGYCRSEAVMAVFLQKSLSCKRIYATVVHAKTNSDGFKDEGITFPSGAMQKQLITEVYNEIGISPSDVSYIEAHGTGTKVGDPQETNAIVDVFCKGRAKPLLIGSTKSNMGHSEAASGLISIAKTIIAMERQVLPPNLHYQTPNPNIPGLVDGRLKVVTEKTPWNGGFVGINSFGFGGANAHVVLRSPAKKPHVPHVASKSPRLFTYSARTPEGVQFVLDEAKKNSESVEFQTLMQESSNMSCSQMPYRGYTILNSSSTIEEIQKPGHESRPVWFVFAGMGSQWQGMGRKMMELDAFRESIMKSSKTLSRYDIDLYSLIMTGDESTFDQTIPSFIGIASMQVALVDLLFSLGIRPDGIVGHSVGELGCAYADGSLTAEEAVLAAYWRGRCISEATLPPGKMAAVGLSWDECKKLCPEGVVPACHNSIDTVTVSGPFEATTKFVEELKAQGVFARDVKSSNVAFHSHYMKAIAPQLKAALEKVIVPKKRSSKWISTSVPEQRWHEEMAQFSSADYHVNNLVSPVLFQEGLSKIPANAIAIEISPHCLLQAILKRSLSTNAVLIGCMKRFHENNVEFFLTSLGKCFANGVNLNPLKAYPPVQFPVPAGTPMVSSCISKIWDHSASWDAPVGDRFSFSSGGSSADAVFNINIAEDSDDNYLAGHKIDGRVLYPATGYLVLAWKALAKLKGMSYNQMPVEFHDVEIHAATIMPSSGDVSLKVSIMKTSGKFEISENDSLVVSGTISSPEEDFLDKDLMQDSNKCVNDSDSTKMGLTCSEVYKELRLRGYEYENAFKGISKANADGMTAELSWDGRWIPFMDTMLQLQILSMPGSSLRLPTRIKCIKVDPNVHPAVPSEGEDAIEVPAQFYPELDTTVAGGVEIHGLHASAAPKRMMQAAPLLEHYSFVPYADDANYTHNSSSVQDYTSSCLNYALSSFDNLLKSENRECIPNLSLLEDVIRNNKAFREDNLEDYIDYEDASLARFLLNIFNIPVEKDFTENAQNVISSSWHELVSDRLLMNLCREEILKPVIDIIIENVHASKLNVFEVEANQSMLYSKIVPWIQTVAVNYTAADSGPQQKDAHNSFGVKFTQWDLSTSKTVPPVQSNLVVVKNILHKQKDIGEALDKLSSMISPQGFVLVEEVTNNFPLYLALESLSGNLDCDATGKDRIYGRYLSAKSWQDIFSSHGFDIVYQKSDSLLSTLFLFRKRSDVKPAPVFLSVEDLSCSWLEDLKSEMKKLEEGPKESRLWLVAKNSLNGVVGLANCLRFETGGDKVRFALISNLKPGSPMPRVDYGCSEFTAMTSKDLYMNVYRDGEWGCFKHIGIPTDTKAREKSCEYAYVNALTMGDLSSLKWIESPLKYYQATQHDDAELCSVYYASLNFKDIMLATAKLHPEAIPGDVATQDCILGMEFSGRNSSGKRVMGILSAKGLATTVDTPSRFLWEIPEHWTMEEAASVPVVYGTAFYALVMRGRIKKGEKILIHSGSGGVGLAAISVALSYGCEVFTSVGTKEKREYLKRMFPQLKDRNICNSRDLSFEKQVLRETNGKGVNLVLNSLAGEKLQASVRLLAKHGRFLEIGKFDLSNNSLLGMAVFLRNISFHGIHLDALFDEASDDWSEVSQMIRDGMESGVVKPLRTTVFEKDEVEGAFRYMAQGKHIGKVLIKIRDEESKKVTTASPITLPAVARSVCHPSKVYIITGGLGGFGLELADWLVGRGAKKIVLTSRSGIRTGYQQRKVNRWRSNGVTVEVMTRDCKTIDETRNLILESSQLGPIGGIFNLAMVLKDGLFENQTADMFKAVLEPKVQGTINLDKVSRELCDKSLEWFVVFSSVSCGTGNLGQTNYGFANSVMERICEQRRAENLPALAIQWGGIGDVGVVAEEMSGDDTVISFTQPQRLASCLSTLDLFLNQDHVVVSSIVLAQREKKEECGGCRVNLAESVGRILGIKDINTIDPEISLADLGLDSLMGVEIKQLLERDFDISLSSKEIRLLNMKKLHEYGDMESIEDVTTTDTSATKTAVVVNGTPKEDALPVRHNFNQIIPTQSIILMNQVTKSNLRPLFIIHPIEGNVVALQQLASSLPCPVYGLQATANTPLTSIEDLSMHYFKQIQTVDSEGPYRIAGYSFGALVAFDMACQLKKAYPDQPNLIESVILLDGSHRFLRMYTLGFRHALDLNSSVKEQAAAMCSFMQQFTIIDHAEMFEHLSTLPKLEDQVAHAVDILMKTDRFSSRTDLVSLAHVYFNLLKIGDAYKSKEYSGNITLVKAEQTSSNIKSADYELSEVCTGSVDVHTVMGDHSSFILGEGAKEVASIISPLLTK